MKEYKICLDTSPEVFSMYVPSETSLEQVLSSFVDEHPEWYSRTILEIGEHTLTFKVYEKSMGTKIVDATLFIEKRFSIK